MPSRAYQNLVVWKRARALAVAVYRATCGPAFRKDWGLRDQMRRAAISIPSNIAEGNERGSDADCVRFLRYAQGSLAELETQTDIAQAIDLLDADDARSWMAECEELGRMLSGLIAFRSGNQSRRF